MPRNSASGSRGGKARAGKVGGVFDTLAPTSPELHVAPRAIGLDNRLDRLAELEHVRARADCARELGRFDRDKRREWIGVVIDDACGGRSDLQAVWNSDWYLGSEACAARRVGMHHRLTEKSLSLAVGTGIGHRTSKELKQEVRLRRAVEAAENRRVCRGAYNVVQDWKVLQAIAGSCRRFASR